MTAAALVGSLARGDADAWSDLDLALRLAPGADPEASADAWTNRLRARYPVDDHLDIWSGSALYRVLLLSDSLQVDLSFWPTDDFASTGQSFELLFGDANPDHPPAPVEARETIGFRTRCWPPWRAPWSRNRRQAWWRPPCAQPPSCCSSRSTTSTRRWAGAANAVDGAGGLGVDSLPSRLGFPAAPARGDDPPVGSPMLERAWAALGGDPDVLDLVQVEGETGLASVFPVGELALAAVAAHRLAARELAPDARPGPVVIDAVHVGLAFRSERFLRVGGRLGGPGFAPLSRFWPTGDGWVRLHANYPHHHDAVLRALGADPVASIAERTSSQVEDAVVGAGGVAAAVRTATEWARHPAGAAVASRPLLELRQVASGPPRATAVAGLRVLDLTRVIAGPVGTRTLASYGADVLRVDSPASPEDRSTLLETGSGKRCTQLDLSAPADRRSFDELLSGADVLVHGYRPGALDRYGFAPEALTERFPHLVSVSLSAWGADGPWAERRGFDSIVQAATGIADATRGTDGTPGVLPAQALDHGAGHLIAATVLRALAERRRRGGSWHGRLSLARLAQALLSAPRQTAAEPVADPANTAPFTVDLPSSEGLLSVVRPPGTPVWRHGPLLVAAEDAGWRDRT